MENWLSIWKSLKPSIVKTILFHYLTGECIFLRNLTSVEVVQLIYEKETSSRNDNREEKGQSEETPKNFGIIGTSFLWFEHSSISHENGASAVVVERGATGSFETFFRAVVGRRRDFVPISSNSIVHIRSAFVLDLSKCSRSYVTWIWKGLKLKKSWK